MPATDEVMVFKFHVLRGWPDEIKRYRTVWRWDKHLYEIWSRPALEELSRKNMSLVSKVAFRKMVKNVLEDMQVEASVN